MRYWNAYTSLVKSNCGSGSDRVRDLVYWRNDLFAGILIYLLPLCLIALLPGLYWSFITGLYVLVAIDVVAVTCMLIIAFSTSLVITTRKIIFIICIYLLSCMMIYYVGLSGPGLVYLLAAGIFSILIFPPAYAFRSAWLNLIICAACALLIHFHIIEWPIKSGHLLGEWIAVSSNLIFLSFLSSALIPRIFTGLQQTIDKEKQLKAAVDKQQESLQYALDMLQEKNAELEQFAYVASHDLNEPLRMITSFMGMLKKKYTTQLDNKAHSYIDFAVDGGNRMQRMIADLLELSRTGRQDSKREMISLESIVQDVKQNMFILIEETGAAITTTTALPVLLFSRTDITRLIQNLFSNAIKFRRVQTTPVIELSATEKKSAWLFSIQDNGIGVPENKVKNVFEIFTRLHSREQYEGTGIGLAICKKIVQQHGGKIWLESAEGKGSIFYVLIKK